MKRDAKVERQMEQGNKSLKNLISPSDNRSPPLYHHPSVSLDLSPLSAIKE